MLRAPVCFFTLFCVLTAPAAGDILKFFKKTPPKTEAELEFEARRKGLMEFAKQVDEMKKALDEWGTLAFAPPVFAPAENAGPGDFALTGGDGITLNSLYDSFNETNGRSQFTQRTLFQAAGAFGEGTNTTTQALEQAKTTLFQANVDRSIATDSANLQLAQQSYSTALDAQSKAQAADDQAKLDAAQKKAAWDRAAAELAYAQNVLQAKNAVTPMDDAAKAAANEAQKTVNAATDTVNSTKEASTVADAKKGITGNQLTAANSDANNKATALNNLQTTAISLPTNAPTAGDTLSSNPLFSAPVLANSAAATSPVTQANNSVDGTPTLQTMGTGALPTPLSGTASSYPPMARINAAASALAVKNILTFLGNPDAASLFVDKRILFAVSSLSVNPGWRTKRDFKGLIDARVGLKLKGASEQTIREILGSTAYPLGLRKLIALQYPQVQSEEQRLFFNGIDDARAFTFDQCRPFQAGPGMRNDIARGGDVLAPEGTVMVSAVTPMVDSQNLDLASSIARQDEIALYLAAAMAQAGASQAGKVFSSWSRMRSKNVATRSSVAVANSFTMGDHFGFELGTRLSGLDESEAKGNKAAQTLDRQTFPLLLILGMHDDSARPIMVFTDNGAGRPGVAIYEWQFQMDYSTRWSRTKHGFWSFLKTNRAPSESYEETMDLDAAEAVADSTRGAVPALEMKKVLVLKNADKAVYDNLMREKSSIVKALHGTGYLESLPSRWLLNKRNTDNDNGLYDGEARLKAESLTVKPKGGVRFANVGETQTVIVCGKGLRLIDATNVTVLGGNLVVAPTGARFLGDDALSVDVKLTTADPGMARLKLPYRSGAVAKAANGAAGDDCVITTAFSFGLTVPPAVPALTQWMRPDVAFAGVPNDQGLWSAHAELVLSGSKLDDLAPVATLRGTGVEGLGDDGQTVTLNLSGPNAVIVPLDITSKAGQGSLYVICKLKSGGSTALVSPGFTFHFDQREPPRVAAWSGEAVLAKGTVDAKDASKWSGTLVVLMQGQALDRLDTPTVLGLSGDMTATAKYVADSAKVGSVSLTLAGVPAQGQVSLQFVIKDDATKPKLFTAPLSYQFVKP